jgi:hypothetical protein
MLSLDQGVGSSGVEGFILAHLCLVQNWSSDIPMLRSNGPSVHLVLLSSQVQLSNSSAATRMWDVGSSDGANSAGLLHSVPSTPTLALGCRRFIRRCHFLFSCVFDFGSTCHLLEPSYHCFITLKNRLSSKFGMWYFGFNYGYIHGTYKCLQGRARQYG